LAGAKNSSSAVSCEEIESLLTAFQDTNSCIISIEMRVGVIGGKRSLELIAHAWNNHTGKEALPLLASASVRCSALRLAHLEGAIIRLLYALDSQLAWGELGGSQKNRA
jgi:hypothetical protein